MTYLRKKWIRITALENVYSNGKIALFFHSSDPDPESDQLENIPFSYYHNYLFFQMRGIIKGKRNNIEVKSASKIGAMEKKS